MSRGQWLEKAARAGDAAVALDALLHAWRADRSTEVAEVVELLSEQLALGQRRPGCGAEWDALEAAQRPEALGVLLESLPVRRSGELQERLHRLGSWPADPRLSSALHRMVLEPPLTASSTRKAWRELYQVLRRVGDPRTPAVLAEAPARYGHLAETIRAWFVERLERLRAEWPAAPAAAALGAEERGWLSAVRAQAAGAARARTEATSEAASEGALLSAIFGAVDDEGPRLVYADLLSAKGDPRGEFIALSCLGARQGLTAAQQKRHDALLKKHVNLWKGRLARAVTTVGLEFERGFPVAGTLAAPVFVAQVLDAPEWATFRRLSFNAVYAGAPEHGRLLRQPALQGLVEVRALTGHHLPALAEAPCAPRLEVLEVQGPVADAGALRELFARAQALRRVRVTAPPETVRAWQREARGGVEVVVGYAPGEASAPHPPP